MVLKAFVQAVASVPMLVPLWRMSETVFVPLSSAITNVNSYAWVRLLSSSKYEMLDGSYEVLS